MDTLGHPTRRTILPFQFVGAAEAADILGVEVQRISRYTRQGRMPQPVVELAATPVWLAGDIEYMRDNGRPRDEASPPIELLGTCEAAETLGVHKSQVGRWLRSGVFPEPTARLRAGPLWTAGQVREFMATRV